MHKLFGNISGGFTARGQGMLIGNHGILGMGRKIKEISSNCRLMYIVAVVILVLTPK